MKKPKKQKNRRKIIKKLDHNSLVRLEVILWTIIAGLFTLLFIMAIFVYL